MNSDGAHVRANYAKETPATVVGVMVDPLGDDLSEVTLLDKMGSDLHIVAAARTSHLGESKGIKKDRGLLHHLYKNQHWTPFRQQVLKFRVKCPLFTARQWRTHQWADYEEVQWTFNEQSGRYVEMPEEFYYSKPRIQAKKNKQGSIENTNEHLEIWWEGAQDDVRLTSVDFRDDALNQGIAKELANRLLPQNIYTTFVWTVNIHSLINFLNMRTDPHAQWEIRQYANEIAHILSVEFPWVYECWKRYRMVVIDTEKETVIQLPTKDNSKSWETIEIIQHGLEGPDNERTDKT